MSNSWTGAECAGLAFSFSRHALLLTLRRDASGLETGLHMESACTAGGESGSWLLAPGFVSC